MASSSAKSVIKIKKYLNRCVAVKKNVYLYELKVTQPSFSNLKGGLQLVDEALCVTAALLPLEIRI